MSTILSFSNSSDSRVFAKLLNNVALYTTERDDSRPVLQHVEMCCDADKFFITAADGYRLIRVVLSRAHGLDDAKQTSTLGSIERVVIKYDALKAIAKVLASHSARSMEPATIEIARKGIGYGKDSQFELVTRADNSEHRITVATNAGFPDMDALIKTELTNTEPTIVNATFLRHSARLWAEVEAPMTIDTSEPTLPMVLQGKTTIGDVDVLLFSLVMPMAPDRTHNNNKVGLIEPASIIAHSKSAICKVGAAKTLS